MSSSFSCPLISPPPLLLVNLTRMTMITGLRQCVIVGYYHHLLLIIIILINVVKIIIHQPKISPRVVDSKWIFRKNGHAWHHVLGTRGRRGEEWNENCGRQDGRWMIPTFFDDNTTASFLINFYFLHLYFLSPFCPRLTRLIVFFFFFWIWITSFLSFFATLPFSFHFFHFWFLLFQLIFISKKKRKHFQLDKIKNLQLFFWQEIIFLEKCWRYLAYLLRLLTLLLVSRWPLFTRTWRLNFAKR